MTAEQAYTDLIRRFKEHNLLGSCASILNWDERTYMPRQGSAHRAEQMALLARLTHEMLTAPEIGQLLGDLEATTTRHSPLTTHRPSTSVKSAACTTVPSNCPRNWSRNWPASPPALSKSGRKPGRPTISPLSVPGWRRSSISSSKKPMPSVTREIAYDALLDEYEPGATAAEITQIFAALRNDLRRWSAPSFHRASSHAGRFWSVTIRWIASSCSAKRLRRPSASTSTPAGSM